MNTKISSIKYLEQLKANAEQHDLDDNDIKLLQQAIDEIKSNNRLNKATKWSDLWLKLASIVEKLNDIFGDFNAPP